MESLSFKCSTCQIYLVGMSNYQRHVNSLEHANRIHLKTLENVTNEDKTCCSSNGDFEPQVSRFNTNAGESMDTSASMVYNSFLKCEPCQKYFTGNEPYQQHLESAGHKKKLPIASDSNQSNCSNKWICDICDKNFSGPVPYEQHMVSSVHKKKLIGKELNQKDDPFASFLAQCKPDTKSDVQSSISQDADLSGYPSQVMLGNASIQNNIAGFRCDICDKSFTGPVPYDQHMISNVHMKKLKEKECVNNMQNRMCNVESVSHNTRNNMPFFPLNQLKCEVCDKPFSGPVPLQQHLSSMQHQKKVQAQELFQKWSTTGSGDQVDSTSDKKNTSVLSSDCSNGDKQTSELSDDFINKNASVLCSYTNGDKQMSELSVDLNKSHQPLSVLSTNQIGSLQFKCDLCVKSFTGCIPYDQHMSSNLHQKKLLQNTNFPISINSSSKNGMPDSLWYCKLCDKQCSGSVPFTQHEMSEAHCKKMRMAEIKEVLLEKGDVGSTKSALIAENANENGSGGNLVNPLENKGEKMSPKTWQTNSDLIMGDVLKDLNFITPETLNVTTFHVNEKIVFDTALK